MGAQRFYELAPVIDPDGIATAQTLSGGGVQNLTLDGVFVTDGVAKLDPAQLVEVDSVGDDSLITFTINGKGTRNINISETIPGAAIGISVTTKYFTEITSITASGNTAADVFVGVKGNSCTNWYPINYFAKPVNIGLIISLSTVSNLTYSIEVTGDDVQTFEDIVFRTQDHADIQNKTVDDTGNYAFGSPAFRLKIFSFGTGTLKLTVTESF